MAQEIPSQSELYDLALNDYATSQGIDVADLDLTYTVQAKIDSGFLYTLYLKLSNLQNNIYPDLAEEDELLRYGFAILDRYPAPATQGQYTVRVTGQIGATISAQTQFIANDSTNAAGYLFILDADYTLVATTDTITVRSLTSGIEPLLAIGDRLTSIQPLTDVTDEVEVTAVVVVPIAAESIDSYREDVLEGLRTLSQGGAPGDYRLWTLEIPELRKVYAFMETKTGDLHIYSEATIENTTGPIVGVPSQSVLDKVYTAPNGGNPESGAVVFDDSKQLGRRPITVNNIYSVPVEPLTVDVNFIGLSNTSVSQSIKTALDVLLYEIRPFVAGAQSLNTKNDILTVSLIIATVVNVLAGTGVTYTSLTMDIDGNPLDTYTFAFGEYPYLNELTNDGAPI